MHDNPFFIFDAKTSETSYDKYIFKDFSKTKDLYDELKDILNEVRQIIHAPRKIIILYPDSDKDSINNHKRELSSRFINNHNSKNLQYTTYSDIPKDIFTKGIAHLAKDNKIIQNAPHGTKFKKPSGREETFFIKTSLALSNYPQICFLALAIYNKLTKEKISKINTFYVDTSSIIALVQAVIYHHRSENNKYSPRILNFKSYQLLNNNYDFNNDDTFTFISASSSGGLVQFHNINPKSYMTLFASYKHKYNLYTLPNVENDPENNITHRLLPVTAEDFSLEYSESKEVIIKKEEIQKLDRMGLIKKLLGDEFKDIKLNKKYDEISHRDCIDFESAEIFSILKKAKFIEKTFNFSLSSELTNYVITDCEDLPEFEGKIEILQETDFILPVNNQDNNPNVIVFLTKATYSQLIRISQKLRKYEVSNITYIIGFLLTSSFTEARNVENSICYNDTPYKYRFYCYLSLPIYDSNPYDEFLDGFSLSKGFVFYEGRNSESLNPKQVYLAMCVILQILRDEEILTDDISHHNVISPENFSRYNDALLQLSILMGAQGRELNFQSNKELSVKMKEVILDLYKQNNKAGEYFAKKAKERTITLANRDNLDLIEQVPTNEELL